MAVRGVDPSGQVQEGPETAVHTPGPARQTSHLSKVILLAGEPSMDTEGGVATAYCSWEARVSPPENTGRGTHHGGPGGT